jgi:hypothetical protein
MFQPSTGLTIAMGGDKGLKGEMTDFILEFRDGTMPTISTANLALGYSHADAAVTGNILASFTKGGATLTGTASTRQEANVTISRGSTNDTGTFVFATPAKTLVYTQVAGDSTSDILATSIATAINADTTLNKVVEAIAIIGAGVTESVLYLRAIYPGEPFVLTSATGSGGMTLTANAITANVRINTLHFDYPDAYGDVPQETAYTWLATGLVRGVATYLRIIEPGDDGTQSFTAKRIQGDISTAGAFLNLDPSTQIVVGQPLSITGFKIKFRKSVT